MDRSVLIAHAARRGSARRIGEVVAATLAARGLEVDLRPAATVASIDGYGAVVLGGPVRLGRWHRDARRFLHRHRRALAGLPVAVFATGARGAADRDGLLGEALVDTPELEPVATGRFVGGPDRASHRVLGHRDGELDPEQVRRWAEDVARELGA